MLKFSLNYVQCSWNKLRFEKRKKQEKILIKGKNNIEKKLWRAGLAIKWLNCNVEMSEYMCWNGDNFPWISVDKTGVAFRAECKLMGIRNYEKVFIKRNTSTFLQHCIRWCREMIWSRDKRMAIVTQRMAEGSLLKCRKRIRANQNDVIDCLTPCYSQFAEACWKNWWRSCIAIIGWKELRSTIKIKTNSY